MEYARSTLDSLVSWLTSVINRANQKYIWQYGTDANFEGNLVFCISQMPTLWDIGGWESGFGATATNSWFSAYKYVKKNTRAQIYRYSKTQIQCASRWRNGSRSKELVVSWELMNGALAHPWVPPVLCTNTKIHNYTQVVSWELMNGALAHPWVPPQWIQVCAIHNFYTFKYKNTQIQKIKNTKIRKYRHISTLAVLHTGSGMCLQVGISIAQYKGSWSSHSMICYDFSHTWLYHFLENIVPVSHEIPLRISHHDTSLYSISHRIWGTLALKCTKYYELS